MATVVMNVGPQSPLNRNLERLLDEAQSSGELRISSRRLREFPKVASKYNLNDTVYGGNDNQPRFFNWNDIELFSNLLVFLADLSKNKLSELPMEVTRFSALEKLNLYHNGEKLCLFKWRRMGLDFSTRDYQLTVSFYFPLSCGFVVK